MAPPHSMSEKTNPDDPDKDCVVVFLLHPVTGQSGLNTLPLLRFPEKTLLWLVPCPHSALRWLFYATCAVVGVKGKFYLPDSTNENPSNTPIDHTDPIETSNLARKYFYVINSM